MWETKIFKIEKDARDFININKNKYQSVLCFINNGFAVEYKKLKRIY